MKKMKIAASIIKWLARIFSGLVFLLMLSFFLGEGIPYIIENPHAPHAVKFELAGLLTVLFGLILGWKWPLAGGILILFGNMAFHIIEGRLYVGTVFAAFDLVGLLYIAGWSLNIVAERFDEA